MKKYKFTVSTSEAHILTIESDNEKSAREKFYEIKPKNVGKLMVFL